MMAEGIFIILILFYHYCITIAPVLLFFLTIIFPFFFSSVFVWEVISACEVIFCLEYFLTKV